jgi:sugar-specific transcriptional regulator TrmB
VTNNPNATVANLIDLIKQASTTKYFVVKCDEVHVLLDALRYVEELENEVSTLKQELHKYEHKPARRTAYLEGMVAGFAAVKNHIEELDDDAYGKIRDLEKGTT